MDDWEKFNETFYSHLNMKDITGADYADAKRVKRNKRRNMSLYQ